MSNEAYIIKLGGYKRDDDETYVVSKEFAEWVDQGTRKTLGKVIVEITTKGLSEDDEDEVITSAIEKTPGSGSSPDNDRALMAGFLYENLETTEDLIKAVGGRKIAWEFEGYVY